MGVAGLLHWLERLPAYAALRRELEAQGLSAPLGLPRAARPAVLAALGRDLKHPILVLAGSVERAHSLTQSLRDWFPYPGNVLRFPEPQVLFYERAPWSDEALVGRFQVLTELVARRSEAADLELPQVVPGEAVIVVASARALMQGTLPVRQFQFGLRELRVGEVLDLEATLERWAGLGYEPASVVELPGQFSHRGGILDIFPPHASAPVRVELFGSQIESLRRFDPTTQRSAERLERVTIGPAREALPRHAARALPHVIALLQRPLPADVRAQLEAHLRHLEAGSAFPELEFYLPYLYSEPATLLDYLPAEALVAVDDPHELAEAWAALEEEALTLRATAEEAGLLPPDYPLPYITWDEWTEAMTDRPALTLGHGDEEFASALAECFAPGPHLGGQLRPLLDHLEAAHAAGAQVVIVSQQARRLAEVWSEDHPLIVPVERLDTPPAAPLTLMQGALAEGWILRGAEPGAGFTSYQLLTDSEVFGWRRPEARRPTRRRRVAPEAHFADLTPGDYVVHVEYGIGVFRGLVTRAPDGIEREYLLVDYEGSDRLYVPIHQADRLSRYIGADDRPPALSRLGSADWQSLKERAEQAAAEVARELLELYAARELAVGHAFSPDTPWQAEMEAAFPYYETEDQLQAIQAIKADMEQPRPMDRLICGDVGYGKTEVALRAAFKAVMDGKQVAVLVPTTVLAQQHYATFRQRLASFPVEVEMLSRFRSPAEQRKVLERLLLGQVDIIIGTHRLLQKDVVFHDLGLLIIDEEQRFGVTHKERLKRMRTEVDVLTMTATPIPRTMYMALTGVRDISMIETPPEERLPVITYVGEYDAQLVRRAILRELERGGQVFYVHNRVQTIQHARRRLEQLVPEATLAVAHGQMREADLERVMLRFTAGEVDVLVCTSIIESGLDIPNANTLIVERADRFGLAQLYQLRGRVGRGAQRAYAYFFHDRLSRLTPDARERLETIREASELGVGYTIAMRDLEIRGAGDILGTRQSGHISAVGFDLYTRMLARAVQQQKAQRAGEPLPAEPVSSVRIDLPIPSRLPEEYIPGAILRLRLYRRLAELESPEQVAEMAQELADRFGPLPPPAQNLMLQLRLKALARRAGIAAIGVENGRLVLRPAGAEFANLERLRARLEGKATVTRRDVWLPFERGWPERLAEVLALLAD
jgi:transcription-repair coupling factor (superfamily II helicase)